MLKRVAKLQPAYLRWKSKSHPQTLASSLACSTVLSAFIALCFIIAWVTYWLVEKPSSDSVRYLVDSSSNRDTLLKPGPEDRWSDTQALEESLTLDDSESDEYSEGFCGCGLMKR